MGAAAHEDASSLRRRSLIEDDDDFGLREPRIVGGNQADGKNFKYHVNLGGCGGTLIAPDIVLTAAHCGEINPFSVLVGGGTSITGQLRYIQRGSGTQHPNYRPNSQDNDLMLYKLTRPVSNDITPITLNNNINNPNGQDELTVIGFGSTSEGSLSGSYYLQKVNVNHVAYGTCNLNYIFQVDRETMFCAGVTGGGKDSCQGDSGGPIIDSKGVLVGVTSWGNGCGRPGFPGIYARVSSALPWIQQETCRMSDNPPNFCNGLDIPPAPPADSDGDQSGSGGSFLDWLISLWPFG